MQKRIALTAPPWYPVPPEGYGGIELVVALLARELRAAGDHVLLFGEERSELASHRLAPQHWSEDLGRSGERFRELTYAAETLKALKSVAPLDIVHDHCGMATLLAEAMAEPTPVLHTVHGPIGELERTFYSSLEPTVGLIAISDAQRASAPSLPWVGTVHNAVDTDALRIATPEEKEQYLLCLARICPDKGQHVAIEVARRSGRRLVLAGKVETTDAGYEYFEHAIKPHLDGDRVVHVHNTAGDDKARLLARAAALLAPLQWDEPFGLAYVEAMASGTPVVAFARGAVPELVEPGVSGFLVDDVDGMVDAVHHLGGIDPQRCASVSRGRFSPAAMARAYSELYSVVIRGDAVPPVAATPARTQLAGRR